jgi:hypothetical protein
MTVTKRTHSGISTNFDALEAARTIELTESDGMDKATSVGFYYGITLGSGNPATITVIIYKSADGGTTYGRVPAHTYSGGGAYAQSEYSITEDITGDDDLWIDVDMRNANAVKVVISSDTNDADDTVVGKACSDYNK